MTKLTNFQFYVLNRNYDVFDYKQIEKYLKFRLVFTERHFDSTGKGDDKDTIFEDSFHSCNETDFIANDFERDFYAKNKNANVPKICVNRDVKEKVKLEGVRDDFIKGKNQSFFRIDVSVCNNNTLTP